MPVPTARIECSSPAATFGPDCWSQSPGAGLGWLEDGVRGEHGLHIFSSLREPPSQTGDDVSSAAVCKRHVHGLAVKREQCLALGGGV